MAETDVIREFLVMLGFKTDEKSLKNFRDGVDTATRAVTRLAATVAATATVVGIGVSRMASKLDGMYFASQRVGASASSLKAFGHTFRDMGVDASTAMASVEALARNMEKNPSGFERWAESIGVSRRDANGELRDQVDFASDLIATLAQLSPHLGQGMAETFGIDEELVRAERLHRRLADGEVARKRKRLEDAGYDKAAEDSHRFMLGMRDLGLTFELLDAQIKGALIERLGPELEKFHKWVEQHGPRVAGQIAEVALQLLEAIVKLAPYLGALVDMFLSLDDATDGWSTRLLAIVAVLQALGGTALIGGILKMVGAVAGLGTAGGASAGKLGWLGRAGIAGLGATAALAAAKAMGMPETDATKGIEAIRKGEWWRASVQLPAADFLGAVWDKIVNGKADAEIANGLVSGGGSAKKPIDLEAAATSAMTSIADSPLGKLISKYEGDYDSVNRGQRHGYSSAKRPLESMTLAQVQQAQANRDFNAAGRWQLIRTTLEEGTKALGLTGEEMFNKETQDKLFDWIINHKRPIIGKYLRGESSDVAAFAIEVAKEWASVEDYFNPGMSYHAGVANNKARTPIEEVILAADQIRDQYLAQNNARLGASGVQRGGVTQYNTTNVTVHGVSDPAAVAREVGDHQVFVGERNSRSLVGVVN